MIPASAWATSSISPLAARAAMPCVESRRAPVAVRKGVTRHTYQAERQTKA